MSARRLLLGLVAALALLLAGPPVEALPSPITQPPLTAAMPVTCRNAGDDGLVITAALARSSLVSVRGPCAIASQVSLGAGQHVYLNGAAITSTVPAGSGTTAVFSALPTTVGSILTLAADTTVGATTLTLTTSTNVAPRAWISLSDGVLEFGQFFQVVSVAGSSNPYTVTLDRQIGYVYTVAGTTVYVQAPAQYVGLHGGGATITATTTQDRCGEFQMIDSLVEDITCAGKFTVGASLDIGSLRSSMRRVNVIGDSVTTRIGVAAESCERCSYADIYTTGIISGATRAGFLVGNSRGSRFTGIHVTGSAGYGIALDVDLGSSGEPGSDGCELDGFLIDHANVGLILANAAKNWSVTGGRIERTTADGIQVATISAGVPSNNRIAGVSIDSAGNDGVLLGAGANTTLRDLRITSAYLHGVEITSGTVTSIVGGSIESCGTSGSGYGVMANTTSSTLIDGVRFLNSITGGIDAISSGTITVRGSTFVSDLGTSWNGIFLGGTNVLRVSDSNFTLSGSGILAAVQTSGGTTYLERIRATGSGTSYGVYVNSGKVFDNAATVDLSGTANPRTGTLISPIVTVDVGPLSGGTKTTASGYVLTGASVAGIWTKTAGGTQVGVPTVTFSTNSIVVTGGASDTSTYTVALSGAH